MAETDLDLSGLAGDEAAEQLERAFQGLAPGGAVVLVTAGSPRALARHLIQHHWGGFDWAPLAADSPAWRTRLARRETPGPMDLFTFLSGDHARCDALLAEAEAAANDGDLERARALAGSYLVGMRRHFEMEEEGFFREFEARMGMEGGGPTHVMREEHTQMRGLLTRMESALAEGDLETFLGAVETMVILMEQHNIKEEQMLYPMADDVFGGDVEELLKNLVLF